MDVQRVYLRIIDRVNLEHIVLLTMLITSAYMIWDSYSFGIDSAATFPRLTGGVVLFTTVLLIFRSYLPEPLHSIVSDSADLIDVDDEFTGEDSEDSSESDDSQVSVVDRPIHDSLMVGSLIAGYGVLSYTIGILWASPIFVLVYGIWFKISWRTILLLAGLSLLIGFGFYEALGLRIDRGEIFLTEGVL
ncbi:hypothetical protein JCM17823_06930 [Halorubrum gandharaense]